MPTQSATLNVQVHTATGRRSFELTAAKQRALATVTEKGMISIATPYATVQSMVNAGLARVKGTQWYLTELGWMVRRRAAAKRQHLGLDTP
jgi:hypothetical protein